MERCCASSLQTVGAINPSAPSRHLPTAASLAELHQPVVETEPGAGPIRPQPPNMVGHYPRHSNLRPGRGGPATHSPVLLFFLLGNVSLALLVIALFTPLDVPRPRIHDPAFALPAQRRPASTTRHHPLRSGRPSRTLRSLVICVPRPGVPTGSRPPPPTFGQQAALSPSL